MKTGEKYKKQNQKPKKNYMFFNKNWFLQWTS